MTADRVLQVLRDIGLTDNEAALYLAALKLGLTTALRLSQSSGIKRTTIYSTLDSLQQKGLVYAQTKGLKRLFVAENPDKLETVLESKKQLLRAALPDLSSLYFNLQPNEGFIRHYQGLEGVKRIYDGLLRELKEGDFYLVISDQQKWISQDPQYFEQFKRSRAAMNLSIRLLLQDSPSALHNKTLQRSYNERLKILPTRFELATNMVIVPHKVIMVQTVEPILALVIENRSIVQMNRTLFEMIWESIPD